MPHKPKADMMSLATDSYRLWAESWMVIGMRTTGMMMGRPGSSAEAVRMVTEKMQANMELAAKFATGGPISPENAARKTVTHYGKRVSANRRRLAKRA